MDPVLSSLLLIPEISTALVSPDRQLVAWKAVGVGKGQGIFLASTTLEGEPELIFETADGCELLSWIPDSSGVIISTDSAGDERAVLYFLETTSHNSVTQLTKSRPAHFTWGGEVTPDNRYLIYAANVNVQSDSATEYTSLIRHDLHSGERVELVRSARGSRMDPRLSPSGTDVLYSRKDRHPMGMQLWVCGIDGSNDHEIINAGDALKARGSWTIDSTQIVHLAHGVTHDRAGVYDLDSSTSRWIIDDSSLDISHAYSLTRAARKVAVLLEARSGRLIPHVYDFATDTLTPHSTSFGSIIPLALLDDHTWVGKYMWSGVPSRIVRYDPRNLDPRAFTEISKAPASPPRRSFSTAKDFHWRSSDGLEIHGWLYLSTRKPALGTILIIHGGPTSMAADEYSIDAQYYVSQGFNVLFPNYRGSTGFGAGFRDAIKDDGWGGREQDDIQYAAKALIAQGIAEPGKIGVTGVSYGGYSSWCQITRAPVELIAAAVPICGMTDLVLDYETTRPDLRTYSEEMMGGTPSELPEKYRRSSPIHYIEQIRGKLLIVQGLNDPNVTPENLHLAQDRLNAAGIPHSVLTFEDEGHEITKKKNLQELLSVSAKFFAEAFEHSSQVIKG